MNKKLTLLSFLAFASSIAYGQVTIGNNTAPDEGALLQLKDGTTDNDNPLVNSKKGLGLPRVKLTNLKPTTDLELAQSIGNTTESYNIDDHIGLLVYNVGGTPDAGLYVWDGTEWEKLDVSGNITKIMDIPAATGTKNKLLTTTNTK